MANLGRVLAGGALAALMLAGTIGEASAGVSNRMHGHRYYAGHSRHYGNPAIGAAVAGTALGIVGLAAGAAAAGRYDEDPGYGYGYGAAPQYYEPYGYDPY